MTASGTPYRIVQMHKTSSNNRIKFLQKERHFEQDKLVTKSSDDTIKDKVYLEINQWSSPYEPVN